MKAFNSTLVCARYSFHFLQVCLLVQIPRENGLSLW